MNRASCSSTPPPLFSEPIRQEVREGVTGLHPRPRNLRGPCPTGLRGGRHGSCHGHLEPTALASCKASLDYTQGQGIFADPALRACEAVVTDRATDIWNQRHSLHALRECEISYNRHRPRQGIANARPCTPLPRRTPTPARSPGWTCEDADASAESSTSTSMRRDLNGCTFRQKQGCWWAAPSQGWTRRCRGRRAEDRGRSPGSVAQCGGRSRADAGSSSRGRPPTSRPRRGP